LSFSIGRAVEPGPSLGRAESLAHLRQSILNAACLICVYSSIE